MVVIAAVDRSTHAKRVVKESAALADAFDDNLQVVHVMSRSEFVELQSTNAERSGKAIDVDRVRELAAQYAMNAATELDVEYEAVGLVGDPSDEVLSHARSMDTRYLVVGSRKRSPAGKAVFGSIPQTILLNASAPVVSVNRD